MGPIPLPIALALALAARAGLAAGARLRPEQMREAMGLKLGAWQTRSTLVELKVEPGPADNAAEAERAAAAMRAQLAKSMIQDQCLWDDHSRLNLPGVRAPGNCEYSRLEGRDGRFAVTGRCGSSDSSGVIQIAMEGTYTSEEMTHRSEATAFVNGTRIFVKMDMASRFTGECAAPPVVLTPPKKGN
jgi:hypothetical protein